MVLYFCSQWSVMARTSTPSPTPSPVAWIKLKDTSFVSTNDLVNTIPASPLAYDSDDTTAAQFNSCAVVLITD
jgi:hypothetical protein